ncbi:MAG: ROK family protein [Daejeonella sp.]
MNDQIIGIAIEDAHVSAGLVDFETRKVIKNTLQRKRVDNNGTADEIISTWAGVIKDIANATSTPISKIGMGLPGIIDYETGVLLVAMNSGRYKNLFQRNIKELLAAKLGIDTSHIRMLSDSASFLQGEVFGGAGRSFKSSLGVTLGLGLGSAKYSNGVVENTTMYKLPFRDSIAEDYISVRWILNRFEALSGVAIKDLLELKQLAATDPRVAQVFDEFAQNLSEFLNIFIRQHNPEVVVIGGYMESSNRFFFDNVNKNMLDRGIRIPILRAILGEQANIIGAASIWYDANPIHA